MSKMNPKFILCILLLTSLVASQQLITFDTISCKFNLTTSEDRPSSFIFEQCYFQDCNHLSMNPQKQVCLERKVNTTSSNWKYCMHKCCDDIQLSYSFESLNKCYYKNKPISKDTIIILIIAAVIFIGAFLIFQALKSEYILESKKKQICTLCDQIGVNVSLNSCGHYFHRKCITVRKDYQYYKNCPTCQQSIENANFYCKKCGCKIWTISKLSSLQEKNDHCESCRSKVK